MKWKINLIVKHMYKYKKTTTWVNNLEFAEIKWFDTT
jgi:hypothetical protein